MTEPDFDVRGGKEEGSEEDRLDLDEVIEDEDGQLTPSSVKKLREQLSKARAEAKENLNGWQRARADFANYKKDTVMMSSEREVRQKVSFAEAIIPALDAFEMAFSDKSFAAADEGWQRGIKGLYSNLLKSLEQFGVARVHPEGEKFDPYRHEALREVPTTNEAEDHTIENVVRSGYSVGEHVIRPAQVTVRVLNQS